MSAAVATTNVPNIFITNSGTTIQNTTFISSTSSSSTNPVVYLNSIVNSMVGGGGGGGGGTVVQGTWNVYGKLRVIDGQECTIELPDGSFIDIKADGSYTITDKDAQVKYRANRLREFNRYINASDLLEEFIDFVADVGHIDKKGFMALPVELFIRWLVIRAAEADGDSLDDDVATLRQQLAISPPTALPAAPVALPAPSAHCRCCGRFISKKKSTNGLMFCSAEHYELFAEKVA